MTDIRTAGGALVRVAPSPYTGKAALVFVECAPWSTPGTAQLTEDEARAVRDALTELLGEAPSASYVERSVPLMIEERTGILRERDLARRELRAARADLTNARADEAEGRRFWGSVTTAGTTEITAVHARAQRAEECAADLMGKLAEANRARQAAEARLAIVEAKRDEARAELARVREAGSAGEAHAPTLRAVREAVRGAFYRTFESDGGETTLGNLRDALDTYL